MFKKLRWFLVIGVLSTVGIAYGFDSGPVSAATYSAGLSTSGSVTVDINDSVGGDTSAVGSDNLTVTSTCPYGYTVSISGPSDRNLYKDGDSSNNTSGTYIAPSSGTTSSPATITGNNVNTWGYSLSSSTGTGTFIGLSNSQTVLTTKNSASASSGDTIPVYYGVSVASTYSPGIYKMTGSSSITYYLTTNENCFSYQVSFNANGGSGTTMANQRIYEGVATQLSANTYTPPTGKVFIGWNTSASGTGTFYSNRQSVTDITTMGNTLTLYAQWDTPIYMQDMDYDQCKVNIGTNGNATDIGDNIIVFDRRDMSDYTVRYINGECWMTKNLRITGTVTASESNFTGSNFNVSQYSLDANDSSYANHCDSTNGYNYACAKDSGDVDKGVWYNYYSATAGTISTNSNTNEATSDICPAGWHLPSGPANNSSSDFYRLLQTTSSDFISANSYLTAFGAVSGGAYGDGSIISSPYGLFWSSTVGQDAIRRNYLDFKSTDNTFRAATGRRFYGDFIRCVKDDPNLYNKVAAQSKGTQTASDLQATISASNSGVYQYNSSAFGADTDGTKSDDTKANIYYYRGILDNTTGTYGSNGDGAAYPNYVILQSGSSKATTDTCWRIIRTTGSGGVKMIYNGLWTGSTCANAQGNTQLSATSTFNGTASTASIARQVVRVGYTHNSSYASTSATASTAFTTVMGTDTTYSVNNTNSTIKDNVETWYNTTISDFEDMLEPNAGYCNDRYSFTTATGTTVTSSIRPYTTSTSTGATYVAYFAGSQRNAQTTKTPSLGCSSGRTTVDIYSTDTSKGGNGQLSAPVGLITADEASFAGSGSSTASQGSGYNANSFLRNGSTFWTMTPYYRTSGYAYNFYMNANGYMQNGRIDTAYGVRPVISLQEDIGVSGGTGVATDPWVIRPPRTPDPIACSGANKICYSPNTTKSDVIGTMGEQSANASTSTTLLASNFSRNGYGFAGWNTEPDYSGTFYGPQQTITTPSNMSNGLPLYAVWVKSKGSMQSNAATICSGLTTAPVSGTASLTSVSALTDQRDGQTYAIAKLADGKCWMIENLRLESTNSDNSTGALAQGYATSTTYGNFSGLATAEISTFSNTTTGNSLYSSGNIGSRINIGTTNLPGYRMPRYNNVNTQSRASSPTTDIDTNIYSYGNYYSWPAAMANTISYNGPTATDADGKTSETVNTSLCPSDWRLPYGRSSGNGYTSGGAYYLNYKINNNSNVTNSTASLKLRSFPNNFVYSGTIDGSTISNRGVNNFSWSSTTDDDKFAYGLGLNNSTVWPGTTFDYKYRAGTVRCVLLST